MKTPMKTHFIGLELASADISHETLMDSYVSLSAARVKGLWLDANWLKVSPTEANTGDVEALEPVRAVLILDTKMTYKQVALEVVGLSGVERLLPLSETYEMLEVITGAALKAA